MTLVHGDQKMKRAAVHEHKDFSEIHHHHHHVAQKLDHELNNKARLVLGITNDSSDCHLKYQILYDLLTSCKILSRMNCTVALFKQSSEFF